MLRSGPEQRSIAVPESTSRRLWAPALVSAPAQSLEDEPESGLVSGSPGDPRGHSTDRRSLVMGPRWETGPGSWQAASGSGLKLTSVTAFASGRSPTSVEVLESVHGCTISPGVWINREAKVAANVWIGKGARIGRGARIGQGARIGRYARIGDYAIVKANTEVKPGEEIKCVWTPPPPADPSPTTWETLQNLGLVEAATLKGRQNFASISDRADLASPVWVGEGVQDRGRSRDTANAP